MPHIRDHVSRIEAYGRRFTAETDDPIEHISVGPEIGIAADIARVLAHTRGTADVAEQAPIEIALGVAERAVEERHPVIDAPSYAYGFLRALHVLSSAYIDALYNRERREAIMLAEQPIKSAVLECIEQADRPNFETVDSHLKSLAEEGKLEVAPIVNNENTLSNVMGSLMAQDLVGYGTDTTTGERYFLLIPQPNTD